jgi:hypothetical protein
MFFFEKKNQKTLALLFRVRAISTGGKVFCFFFSKKKAFLAYVQFLVLRPSFTRASAGVTARAPISSMILRARSTSDPLLANTPRSR